MSTPGQRRGRRTRTGHAQDVDALKELLRSRRPAVIALGTRNLEIRRLQKEVEEIVKELGAVGPRWHPYLAAAGFGLADASYGGRRVAHFSAAGARRAADRRGLRGRRAGAPVHDLGAVRAARRLRRVVGSGV